MLGSHNKKSLELGELTIVMTELGKKNSLADVVNGALNPFIYTYLLQEASIAVQRQRIDSELV